MAAERADLLTALCAFSFAFYSDLSMHEHPSRNFKPTCSWPLPDSAISITVFV